MKIKNIQNKLLLLGLVLAQTSHAQIATAADSMDYISKRYMEEDGYATGGGSTSGKMRLEDIAFPTIIADYDHPAEPHYEPRFTQNDDGINMREAGKNAYYYQREAEAKFKKRIWRRVDVRQKMNKSFTWQKSSFIQIVYDMAIKGQIRCYASDSLQNIMSPENAYKQGGKVIIVDIPNPLNPNAVDEGDYIPKPVYETVKVEKIQKVEFMEDWIFDYKYGEMRPQIIGVALLYEEIFPNGMKFDMPLFWVKMDDLRATLAKSEVYNRYNDAARISWDDAVNQYRLFDSYVVKQTDYDDLHIAMKPEFQMDGVAALLEGERIDNELFIMEHDVWEY